jgi:hypothetical protein
MRNIFQAGLIVALLWTATPGYAQDVETEEMICRDIGDIFCLLEEFSKSLEGATSLAAKPTPNTGSKAPLDRSVIELQRDRRETKISLTTAGQPTEVTLINLAPEVNVWYLLKLQWNPQKIEWYHLDNADPSSIWVELNPQQPTGLWLRNGKGGDKVCELWTKDSGNPLRAARMANAPYAPICDKALYVRNRIEGYRTTKEWVVEFLRANIWGGETITNIVKETVYKDNFLLKSDPVGPIGRADSNELPNAPANARVSSKMRGELLPVKDLGISVSGASDESLEVGRWYRTKRQEGVFVSVIVPKAIDEDIMKSHRDYVRELDNVEMDAVSILAAFDTTMFDVSFAVGTDHPAVGWSDRVLPDVRNSSKGPDGFDTLNPLTATGLIPPYLSDRVVGIFTGGFKRDHGAFRWGDLARKNFGSHYGFMENGTVLSSLVPDLASLIVYKDGRVDMKTWTDQDALNLASMKHVRQNGVPIIDWNELTQQAVPGRWVSNWTLGNWSGSQDKKFRSLRAGVCEAENKGRRFLIYGYFSSMTPAGMARVFQSYGCTYAMHLDMNALEHTYLSLYSANKAKDPAPQHLVKGMKVLDERFKGNVPRYIGYPDNRDFFYFTEKKK